ncbi:MarR family winged helix-turn-helix transcriptional regulator [Nocardia vinacea]|uniref:MarR family winged helix-turn-helix transcriptional regulator n=1 Tax=Nocardia vinacea TaxID=96468 RepID=UPI003AF2E9E4|nr:MarR family winged helix-turn-helix transcriptional regulator [Nocardia vinacea]
MRFRGCTPGHNRQSQLDYGTVSPLVQRLRAHGLVESVRSTNDRRAVELRATEAGRALQPQARQMIEAVTVVTLARQRPYERALPSGVPQALGPADRRPGFGETVEVDPAVGAPPDILAVDLGMRLLVHNRAAHLGDMVDAEVAYELEGGAIADRAGRRG